MAESISPSELFSQVQTNLDINKSLPWQLSVDALTAALNTLDTPETEQFLDDYLFKVVALMTLQNPSKLGVFERNITEESILISMNILLKVLPHRPHLLGALAKLFDSTTIFYNGTKVGFTYTPGHPAVRIQMAKRFAAGSGFDMLVSVFRQPKFTWPGGDMLHIFLKLLNIGEILNGIDDGVKEDLANTFMQMILLLPDEQLKRENTEVLNHVLRCICGLCRHLAAIGLTEYTERFRLFWFENTVKVMNSGSLVLKLFAWEQFGELLQEAKFARPLASSYIVEGAGSDFVNGVYTMVHKAVGAVGQDNDVLAYTKAASKDAPLLTLFRCTMRTKAKWWFISQADLEKPGTDKDIDYYLHKTVQEEEREPPPRGWTRVTPGISLLGLDPPPSLKKGSLLIGKGMARESYFDFKLLEMCAKSNLLGSIFGPSMHREIVARSGKLLQFLTEYESFKHEDLQAIWKAALQCHDADIVDEIFSVLVPVAPFLSNSMFEALTGLAQDALQQTEHFAKIAHFVEQFAMENYKYAGVLLTDFASANLLALVWDVYKNAHFETLKNTLVIQELLSHCLSQKGGIDHVVPRILECKKALDVTGKTADEASVSRVIRSLTFLLTKHAGPVMIEELESHELVPILICEVERYVLANRKRLTAGPLEITTFSMQLSDRLDLMRKFYSIHPSLTIPFEHLQSLSALLVHNPVEVEAFFSFLKNSSKAVVSVEDALKVFQQFVCSPEVDWARCGDEAFECFSTYYCELEGNFNEFPSTTELPPRLGLDTLWRIALNIGTHIASTSAINLLLQAYDTIMFQEPEAYSDMLRIVFSYLEDAISTVSIETDGNTVLSLQSQARVYRCISILSAALAKSKGEAEPAHAVRGTMFRMNITVFYRRVTSYFNSVTQTDVTRYEKGSEGLLKMEVHPLHTIKDLKERIIEQADLGSVTINFEHPNKDFISNTSRVSELNLADGGELSVTYQSSFHTKSYEDDLYSENTSTVGNSRVAHIGQILSNNYSMFDSLLTLCELCKDADLTRSIWQLIMLIPTQVELIQQSVDQVTYQDASTVPGAPATTTMDWNKILQSASETRTAYLLQIIDNILQPAPELITPVVLERSVHFRGAFIATDGFATVLRILISAPTDDTIVNTTTLAVALHIVHFLLFGPEAQSLNTSIDMEELDDSIDRGLDAINTAPNSDGLLEQVEASSAQVIEKLLHVARNAAAQQSSQVVQNALMVITKLIKSSEAASQLSSNPQSEVLLTTVLRSESKKVREMAANFAVQVGRTQPVVFRWLLSQLKDMSPLDHNCSELFTALSTLLTNLHSAAQLRGEETVEGSQQLARILSDKLLTYPRTKLSVHEERNVLQGYLETLDVLIGLDPLSVKQTQLGENLVESFLNEFLFTMPTEEQQDGSSICDSQLTRQAAFHVLASYLAVSQEGFEQVLGVLGALSKQAARHMHGTWGMQVSHDVKKPEMTFTGLKNQGCTCYMNSLLQVLFMSTAFREAVLATPLLEIHRTTLWHKSDIDLVGNHYLFEYASGSWRTGQIIGYDPVSAKHRVQYTKADGTFEEAAHFNVHQGRHQRETGRVRVIPSESDEPLNEREDAAYRVLDQLQRTFCFMKLSKKRYFDPVHFVDACKSLNLNFNVYHQNDAAEFCDQLLDRIETATKGKHTKKDIWRDVFLKNVFGGNWLYQKIPQDCEVYSTSKEGCGHWQSSRLESFLKVELMIRGKEKIEDSLAELMQGELMDGDNKIHCDVCTQKKATVRRTCFGGLPNTMVLHLKRFDLDFQTFETVKLNNRMAFPARINMLEYTKEGIEAEEKRKAAEVEKEEGERQADEVTIQYETADGEALDPSDFEYELQGVLVHAGIAQGGHYYSFIRDDATADQWYKFDDDEVTPFSSDQIPTQCFGGPPSANNSASTSNLMEEDRTSNALMLLYNKVKKASPLSVAVEDESTLVEPSAPPEESQNLVMVDGTQAYQREVRESNMQHILTCYLLDPDLHSFVRGMLSSITSAVSSSPDEMDALNASITQMNLSLMQWDPSTAPDDLPLRTVQFNCSFLLDVVLHCRERAAMRSSIHVLSAAFDAFPHTAMWFLSHVLDTTTCAWFLEYTLHSADALARAAFVQIVVAAVSAIAPKDPLALSAFKSMKISDVKIAAGENHPAAQLALLVRLVLDHTFKSVLYTRNADELFVLIRDLAALPCMNKAFLEMGLIAFLSYFIMPDQVAPVIRTLFEKHLPPARLNARIEYTNLLHCVFEALAALLGVPQIRKVSLLQERTYYESDLVPDAREALSTIFAESSHNGGMDATDITKYFEKVTGGTGTKVAPQHIRNLLDRFHTSPDGRLSLTGFLQYHTDAASYNPKNVWRDLHAFGYKNNLTRAANVSTDGEECLAPAENADGALPITENCRSCLAQITLYEVGMGACDAATRAIAKRVCLGDGEMSALLLQQGLAKLLAVACENTWNHAALNIVCEFLRMLLCIEDGLQKDRLYEVLMHAKHGVAVIAHHEKLRPSNCRANEYNKYFLFERYVGFVQELTSVPTLLENLTAIAELEPKVKFLRGFLRLKPGCNLTENEDAAVRNSVVVVEHAGVVEVNGEYHFRDVRHNAGCYVRKGIYAGKEVMFTLYKCSLKNGGYQWFLSITPEGFEPGTTNDIDFYYALARPQDKLPPSVWLRMNPDPQRLSRDPAPSVHNYRVDQAATAHSAAGAEHGGVHASETETIGVDSSDSEKDDFLMVGDDGGDGVDDSFVSNSSDHRGDYYDTYQF